MSLFHAVSNPALLSTVCMFMNCRNNSLNSPNGKQNEVLYIFQTISLKLINIGYSIFFSFSPHFREIYCPVETSPAVVRADHILDSAPPIAWFWAVCNLPVSPKIFLKRDVSSQSSYTSDIFQINKLVGLQYCFQVLQVICIESLASLQIVGP